MNEYLDTLRGTNRTHLNIKINELYIPFFIIVSSDLLWPNTTPATLKVHGQELCNMIVSQNKEIMSTQYL
jgi:hypothetical protein